MPDVAREGCRKGIANSQRTISEELASLGLSWAWSLAEVARFCRMALLPRAEAVLLYPMDGIFTTFHSPLEFLFFCQHHAPARARSSVG